MTDNPSLRNQPAPVVAIVCGWTNATTIIRCQRCALPMVDDGRPVPFCSDCREWLRAWR